VLIASALQQKLRLRLEPVVERTSALPLAIEVDLVRPLADFILRWRLPPTTGFISIIPCQYVEPCIHETRLADARTSVLQVLSGICKNLGRSLLAFQKDLELPSTWDTQGETGAVLLSCENAYG